MAMTNAVHWLSWDDEESKECQAQAIITNGTDYVWISCTTYIARGRLLYRVDDNKQRTPMGIEFHLFNRNALDGPRAQSQQEGYYHISDGDYVVLHERSKDGSVQHRAELWFGLEEKKQKNKRRVIPGAIVRYDPDTLEFIDMHVHPSMNSMPFLAFDARNQLAYVANWTDNANELVVFDARRRAWSQQNATISGLPPQYESSGGIDYIQGSDMQNGILYLMVDDFSSTLIEIDMWGDADPYHGTVIGITHLGLGREREGIAFVDDGKWLLAIDNTKNTREGSNYAEIVCVSMEVSAFGTRQVPSRQEMKDMLTGLTVGLVFGVIVAALLARGVRLGQRVETGPSYGEVDQQTTSEGHDEAIA